VKTTILLLASFMVSFFVTLFSVPVWIRHAHMAKLVGGDMHKKGNPKIAESGGVSVILGFFIGIMTYVAIKTFWFKTFQSNMYTMAVLTSILIIFCIGLVDDILGWKIGFRQRYKPFFTLLGALPFMVLSVGESTMALPFLGAVNFGLLYPLVIVPLIFIGASNAFNMLAGYNGLEAGMGVLILGTMGYVAWTASNIPAAVFAFCTVFALIAFLVYNMYPAKVFPGDVLTYPVGAMIAIVAIVGNMEKIAAILFIPYFVELLLKLRGKFKKESFAEINADGGLSVKGIYGLEHLMVRFIGKFKKKVKELEVVVGIWLLEAVFVVIALMAFNF